MTIDNDIIRFCELFVVGNLMIFFRQVTVIGYYKGDLLSFQSNSIDFKLYFNVQLVDA